MQVTFLLTAAELETARKAFSKRVQSRFKRALPWINVGSALFLAGTYLVTGLFHWRAHRVLDDRFALALSAVWLGIAIVHWYTRDGLNFEPDYGKEQSFELNEDGIFRETESPAKVRVPWTRIGRYAETDEFFLLSSPWPWGIEKPGKSSVIGKRNKQVLYIVPKRALNSLDIDRFRDLLQRKLSVWAKNPRLKADTILSY